MVKVDSWAIKVWLDNGDEVTITDMPNDVSQPIDDMLSEMERNNAFKENDN